MRAKVEILLNHSQMRTTTTADTTGHRDHPIVNILIINTTAGTGYLLPGHLIQDILSNNLRPEGIVHTRTSAGPRQMLRNLFQGDQVQGMLLSVNRVDPRPISPSQ